MKHKKIFILVLIFSLIFGFNAFAREVNEKLEDIKTQIHILNLLNGLELNKKQMQLIVEVASQAENIRREVKKEIKEKENEIISAYSEVLRVAKTGSIVIPQDIAMRVHKINGEIDKIKEEAQKGFSDLAVRIKNILEPHQLHALDEYRACIIPPVKKGRIGQVDDHSGFVKILEKIYSMPNDIYNLKKGEIVQKQIDKVRAKVPAGYILDQEKLKTQLLKAMEEARTMSEVDFTIKKEKIAQDVKTQLVPERPPVNIGVKIENFLLQPEVIPILKERILKDKSDS